MKPIFENEEEAQELAQFACDIIQRNMSIVIDPLRLHVVYEFKSLVKKPQPHQFERGDRVCIEAESIDGDITKIEDWIIHVERDDGVKTYGSADTLTLITAARDREIQVGDTFENTKLNSEHTAANIDEPYITDTNGINHLEYDCTFRSRPKQPKPKFTVDDAILEIKRTLQKLEER